MNQTHPCPNCGKPMIEAPKFPGLWTCQDFRQPLNAGPPYRYRCTGSELMTQGANTLERELTRKWLGTTRSLN